MFTTTIDQCLLYVRHEYEFHLNTKEVNEPLLSFYKNRCAGGTLVLWRKHLDPYITVLPTESPAILPISLSIPGVSPSIHTCIYLPTHGRDNDFLQEISNLKCFLHTISAQHSDHTVCLRGDKNANKKNTTRCNLITNIFTEFSINEVYIEHPTYHHFVGNGLFDSNIDTIALTNQFGAFETIDQIICRVDHPEIGSHHDVILSTFHIPEKPIPQTEITIQAAPRTTYTSPIIQWTRDGEEAYQQIVSDQLKELRSLWHESDSKALTSVFIQCTNDILINCSMKTNPWNMNNSFTGCKPKSVPYLIKRARQKMKKKFNSMCKKNTTNSREQFEAARKAYKQTVRKLRIENSIKRDTQVDQILSSDPRKVYAFLKKLKGGKQTKIESLKVGDQIYTNNKVGDGFFHSMSSLKFCDEEALASDSQIRHHFSNYDHLMKLCNSSFSLPSISFVQALSLLKRLKPKVSDIYGISPRHYLNAGVEGVKHFQFILNDLLKNVDKTTISELNTALGIILYKGHNKDRNLDKSYRTISTCPVLAKALDLYIRDLYQEQWNAVTAETQYQSEGSSHELASLLITEMIQYSLNVADTPIYLLALDAQSAFDRCLRQILCTELFMTGIDHAALKLVNNRLKSRHTVYQWDNQMIGPAKDITGFEQGGINSGDFYKLYNNEQLNRAQSSCLGVDIGSGVISGVGQADDVILSSNDLNCLGLLSRLTEEYCNEYRVKLVATKTKLLVMYKTKHEYLVSYAKLTNRIKIDGVKVEFVDEAEHVGVLRSSYGNMPNILNRISCHKKALASIGCAGLSFSQRVNPAANLRIHKLYAAPILFSGLASLVLKPKELNVLISHYKSTLQRLQRLHEKTPRGVVYLLAGSLPPEALLHMKQLSLFSMISRRPDDPLHKHGRYILKHCSKSSHSWFYQVKDILDKYGFRDPLFYLDYPLQKTIFKQQVKTSITIYWQNVLVQECKGLRSLKYFRPELYSLQKPHYMWTTSAGKPYETSKATILAKMISGRFRSEMFCRHFSKDNKLGNCSAPGCFNVPGTLEHILVTCPYLEQVRERMVTMCLENTVMFPSLHQLIRDVLTSNEEVKAQFFLEPLAFPLVRHEANVIGPQFIMTVGYITRTFVFNMNREYQKRFK